MPLVLRLALFLFVLSVGQVIAQTRAYLLPDIGTPGRNTYVEIVAQVGGGITSFPVGDGFATNTSIVIETINPNDTARVIISPVVISWESRHLGFQIFVKPNAALGPVPIRIRYPNNPTSIPPVLDTFFIVTPTPIGVRTGGGVLGGGTLGRRSKRGAMIVDSLILSNGVYTVDATYDPDLTVTGPGNQAYLPTIIICLGRMSLSSATISVSAVGKDGGPGGGGGGGYGPTRVGGPAVAGERDADAEKALLRPGLGNGFAGGVSNLTASSPGPFGLGSGPNSLALNGVASSTAYSAATRLFAAGPGHPFDEDGRSAGAMAVGATPGSFGIYQGGGGNAGPGSGLPGAAPTVVNGQTIGNRMIVPLHGGAGGAGGGSYDSIGGGGGGGLSIHTWLDAQMDVLESNGARGRDGFNGPAGSGDPSGGGAGGCIIIGARLPSRVTSVNVAGGVGGTRAASANPNSSAGTGSPGRFRLDGRVAGVPVITSGATNFAGPTMDTISFADSVNWRLRGTGRPGDSIIVYQRGEEFNWSNYSSYTARVNADSTWQTTIQFPYDTLAYLFAVQKTDTTGGTRFERRPLYIFSQSAASIVRLRLIARMQAPVVRNLDTIRCGDAFIDTFLVTNNGTNILILRGTSGFIGANASRYSITSPSRLPDTIFPGQRRTVRITVPANAPEGNLSDTLRLRTNDPNDPVHDIVVRLYKETESHSIGPRRIDMGAVYLGRGADTIIKFINNNTYIDSIITVDRVFGPTVLTYIEPTIAAVVQGRDTAELKFRFTPTDTTRTTTRYIIRTSPCNKIDTIEVTGYGVTGIINSRKRVDFPTIACGDTAVDSVWVKNTGNAPLTVHAPVVIGQDQSRYTIISPPSGDYPKVLRPFVDSFLVVVRVIAQGSGLLTAQLRFDNSDSIRVPRPDNPWYVNLSVEPDRAVLRLSDTVMELGTLCLGGSVDRMIRMDNPSSKSIFIQSFERRTNVTAFAISTTSLSIGSGAQEQIAIRYRPLTAGEFYDTIDIVTFPCSKYFRVILHGTAVDASLLPSSPSVDFGDVQGGSSSRQTFVLRNSSTTDPLDVGAVLIDPPNGQLRVVWPAIPPPRTLAPGDTMRVIVEYSPAGASPLSNVGVKAVINSPCRDTVDVPLSGRPLKGAIGRTQPREFVSSPCNSNSVDQQIRIYNTGNTTIRVQPPSATPIVFSVVSPVAAFDLRPGDTQVVTLRYTPGSVGTISGTLTINTNDPENLEIKDILSGRRDTALIQPRDPIVRFQKVPYCRAGDTFQLVLRNNGTVTDTVISVSSPAPFEVYPATPAGGYILAPGDTVALRLVFRGVAPGPYTANLEYITGVCRQTFTVRMEAEKVDSVFSLDPVDFGDVQVGSPGGASTIVQNATTLGMRVSGARIIPPHPDVTIVSYPSFIGPMGSGQVDLQFAPQSAGALPPGTTIELIIDSSCTFVLSAPVSGRGIEGGIAFSRQFDAGTVLFCRDTLDSVMVRNIGQYAVRLYPPTVNPPASAPFFTVVNFASDVTLAPGDSAPVVIRFTPGAGVPGPILGSVDFTTDDPTNATASLAVRGVRGAQQIALAGAGLPQTGSGAVSTGSHWIVNTSNAPLTVNTVNVGAPFRVTSTVPNTPTTLQPGDSLLVNLEFAPQTPQVFNDSLVVVSPDAPCGINSLAISGEGIDLSVINADGRWLDARGAPGDIVRIPLQLSTDVGSLGVLKCIGSVRFNPTVLVPLRVVLDKSIVPGWQVTSTQFERGLVRFTCEGTTPLDSTGVLAELEALVALGDSTISAVTAGDTVALVAPRAFFKVAAGQFTLLSNCRVGGDRLVEVGEGLKIAAVRPDPVRDVAEVEFNTVESGRTSLLVYDALGRSVAVLLDENLMPNSYVVSFSGRELPSGVYYLELRSPTQRERRQVVIGR